MEIALKFAVVRNKNLILLKGKNKIITNYLDFFVLCISYMTTWEIRS